MNIADQTERELIETILRLYTADEKACHEIAKHIAIKLTQRRAIIRGRRVATETAPSKPEGTNQEQMAQTE